MATAIIMNGNDEGSHLQLLQIFSGGKFQSDCGTELFVLPLEGSDAP